MTNHTATMQPGFALRELVLGHLNSMVKTWRTHRQISRTITDLGALSDRDLADIGIARWQIRDVARSLASQPVR